MKALRTIILAAGKGTRMKSASPKVLHEANGKPVLAYVLDVAQSIGSLKIYAVLGFQSDEVKKILPLGVEPVIQKKLLGTADAVRCVAGRLKSFRGDVVIMCGDTPLLTKETVKALVQRHRREKNVCTVLTCVVDNPSGYGRILRDENARVAAIREDKDAQEHEKIIAEINVGVYCVNAQALLKALSNVSLNQRKGEFYLTDIIEYFAGNRQKVGSFETKDAYEGLGVNSREDLAFADKVLRQRVLKRLMLNGVTIVDPATTFVRDNVSIGQDTVIFPFTFIEQNVTIGNYCKVGPFARVRMGTIVGNYCEIGNFSEVSRARIGNRTLMKHFGFLGDAVVGDDVNIGAGTVTANFDGVHKNKTTILNGAFIGSDSILVAPVRVGQKSVIGAGSVLTKGTSVPDGCVAVGVPAKVKGKK